MLFSSNYLRKKKKTRNICKIIKESYKPIISRKTDFQNIKGTNCYQYSTTQEVFHEFFLRMLLENKLQTIKMTRKTVTYVRKVSIKCMVTQGARTKQELRDRV